MRAGAQARTFFAGLGVSGSLLGAVGAVFPRWWKLAAIAAALLVVAGLAGWYAYQSQRPDRTAASAPPPAGADAAGVRIGTGPVTVDVYLDFMCPHCRDFEDKAEDTLAKLVSDGTATVVYHSIVWQYLPLATRERIVTTLSGVGARATERSPLAYLRMEPGDDPTLGAELRLTSWPPARTELLARSGYHGRPVRVLP